MNLLQDNALSILQRSYPGWIIWWAQGERFPYCADWYARRKRDGRMLSENSAEALNRALAAVNETLTST